ncbi:hypothetical protein [Methylovulum psychrotolerans]|jgi:hypothetical protein|uniref:DUF4398 domain-containing protein n=1 Tax=Methylovulum psychrotolerans TaxID=1704499 RepID=A0A1Z4C0Q5_9GAMM|nr:hypothetical protein [Methylovulum psychrotolerans]ASF47124.1 hypothetical protein CEK71_14170 [Methylovulum psychrotolerans]MBT9098000.1 hypothetical protein [Methylovulum psychrotolerans]POZ53698.1 hypothetical protein AADEFJLK_00736 [Methylovulum psychrotolerans]
MKQLKKTVLSMAMAATMVLASSPIFAEATGEASVKAAAEGTIAKIEEAVGLAEKGADKKDIVKAINDARQLQKEFRYELTERQRQKSNDKLRIARDTFEEGDKTAAEAKLREALTGYKEMKETYDANHK